MLYSQDTKTVQRRSSIKQLEKEIEHAWLLNESPQEIIV